MSKFCTSCGKEVPNGAAVCPNCGTAVDNGAVNNVAPAKKTNGLAIAGFVVSLVSLLCCGACSVVGLVLSIVGLVQAKKYDGNGKGMAIAGIIIGAIAIVLWIVFFALGMVGSIAEEMA